MRVTADKIINDIESLRYKIMSESQRDATRLLFNIYLDEDSYMELRVDAAKKDFSINPGAMSPNIDMIYGCPIFRVKGNLKHYNIAEQIE